MSMKLYGKEDGQEFEVQGFVYGSKDTAEVVVLNTKSHRLSCVAINYLDTMKAEDRVKLEKKLTEEAHEQMKGQAAKLSPTNGQSGMSPKQAEEHAAKTGVNSQGQKLTVDRETGKMVVDTAELDGVESSETPHHDSLVDKAKHALHSRK